MALLLAKNTEKSQFTNKLADFNRAPVVCKQTSTSYVYI